MIEYKRFISYMYIYRNRGKDANVGYVKVESKNGKCKLSVNIKLYDMAGKEVKVYMFYRNKNGNTPIEVYAGSVMAKSNICDVIYKTDTNDVFGSGVNLDKMSGVFAIIDNKNFCATEWDDKEINFAKLYINGEIDESNNENQENSNRFDNIDDEKSSKDISTSVNEINKDSKDISNNVNKLIKDNKVIFNNETNVDKESNTIFNSVNEIDKEHKKIFENMNEVVKESKAIFNNMNEIDKKIFDKESDEVVYNKVRHTKEIKKENNTYSGIGEMESNNTVNFNMNDIGNNNSITYTMGNIQDESILKNNSPIQIDDSNIQNIDNEKINFIKRIFEKYPGMYPFEDDEIIDCVKLEPYDIGVFPMDKWVLANNSFLLHGFYTYRHLIFARKRGDGQSEYILGVPGIYRDRERFMAGMFGFKNFKSVRNTKRSIGDFGYWYMEIRL